VPADRATVSDRALACLGDQERELDQVRVLLDDLGVDPATVTVGAADRIVLAQAEALTGRPLELTATCVCGAVNAVTVAVADLPATTATSRWLGPGTGLRAPTYGDLLDLAPTADGPGLVARCTIGAPPSPASLDDLADLDDALAGPLRTACVDCQREIEIDVDLVTVALRRMLRVAGDLDREVHLLASAYGWDLATIESLPRTRRRRLSRMVADG
jgi:hypothetical protein